MFAALRMPKSNPQVQSPSRSPRASSKLLGESLSKDELLRRLKKIAQDLSDACQDGDKAEYHGTATVLARTFIIKHTDKDVRLHAACCLANVLRIYAPDQPYDTNQLWSIFDLIISQLEGLKYANAKAKGEKGASYEKLFSLLETLALVETLTLCAHLEFTDLILKFFKNMFSSVREEHSKKVKNFMLDIMSSLLSEMESVPQELLDIILENIVNPKKASNKAAYELARSLIERNAAFIEPHIQQFFNNALFFDKASESALQDSLYEVLYELYKFCPSVLLSVLPQLEFKLKSVDEKERLAVVALVAKMFSDEESTLAQSHKPLWHCFLGRFVDINTDVRVECTKHAKDFFPHHPELVREISEKLLERQRDTDDKVRTEVVTTICEAASENVNNISQKLFDVLIERLRDRKLHIRTDTSMSLGRLYKKISAADVNSNEKKKVSWIPTKILHCYYQNSPEDRLHVERVFLGCLVPISLGTKERMKRLLTVYQSLDEPAVKAFTHMFKSQASLRTDMNEILRLWEEHQKTNSEGAKKRLTAKISLIARVLPEPFKPLEHLKSLVKMLSDKKLLNLMKVCFGSGQDCAKVTKAVSEVVVKFGTKSPMFETIKAILDRAAPLLIDTSGGKELVSLVMECVNDGVLDDDETNEEYDDDVGASGRKALDLLLTCVSVFPAEFKFSLIFEHLLVCLKNGDDLIDFALRVLTHIGEDLEEVDSTLYSHYQPALGKLFLKGTPSQVKLTGRIVNKMFPNSSTIFERILKSRLESLEYGSSSLLTTLSCISEIALLAPTVFEPHHATIIRDFVVKDLLMKDRGKNYKSGPTWCDEDDLSKEVKAKILGLKILVNWLRGMPNGEKGRAQSVFLMLDKTVRTNGDVNEGGRLRSCEMSHLRLAAACGILKLAQIPVYHQLLEIKYCQNLISIIKDPLCAQVRERFAKKLSKGLDSLKLPLEYLALFSFYGRELSKELRQQAKQMILRNTHIRNEYLKQHKAVSEHSASMLPEYAMPYLIYMLSHLPDGAYADFEFLRGIKVYLWFFMECILTGADNYNFMKKLAENIKQTKDANAEEDVDANHAIYVVCDIVIGVIMDISKTKALLLQEYPADIVLPKKLYSPLGKGKVNTKSYLPKGFIITPVKRPTGGVPKITPTKNVANTSSSSSGKRKTPADKPSSRASEKVTGKTIQKSLLSMLGKKDEKSQEKISDDENGDTTSRNVAAEKDNIEPMEEDDENDDEEKFTKVSPRKKPKSSTAKEEVTKSGSRASTRETAKHSPAPVAKEPTKVAVSKKPARVPNAKKREQVAATNKRQSATTAVSSEKQTKKTSAAVMKEEKPTRSSPRNQKPAAGRNTRRSDVDEIKRTLDKGYPEELSKNPMDKRSKDSLNEENGSSQPAHDDSQTDTIIPSPPKSPVKKRKIVAENPDPNPLEQSSLVIKRKRKRR